MGVQQLVPTRVYVNISRHEIVLDNRLYSINLSYERIKSKPNSIASFSCEHPANAKKLLLNEREVFAQATVKLGRGLTLEPTSGEYYFTCVPANNELLNALKSEIAKHILEDVRQAHSFSHIKICELNQLF